MSKYLKHTKRVPCVECPFRKTSTAGWLGPDTPEEVASRVHGEAEYACHMHVAKLTKVHGVARTEDTQQCAGAIACANKSYKRYRDPVLYAHQKRVPPHPDIMNIWEFLKHHKREKS